MSADRPALPPHQADRSGPTTDRLPAGTGPARLVAIVLVVLVAGAIWKPWASPGGPTAASSARPGTTAPSAAVSTPVPSGGSDHPTVGLEGPTTPPPVAALDLVTMGVADGHDDWGIAVASVDRARIVQAVRGLEATVTPTVRWTSLAGLASSGSALNDPDSVTIAIAVTWPGDLRPRSVELVDQGAPGSLDGGSGRGRSAGPVALIDPLPQLVRLSPAGLAHANPLDHVEWQLLSGTFFLPSADPPVDPLGWLTDGWRPGRYAFRVSLPGESVTIPFRIGT